MENSKIKGSINGNTVILNGNVKEIILNGISIDLSPYSGGGGIRIPKRQKKLPHMPSPLESIERPGGIKTAPVAKYESRRQLRHSKSIQLKKELGKYKD
ncbi:MAG TPA: hypothetical protein DEQ02_01430 [Ruminococcaceae bacterium]|nr:hypothetical protein [Oscillospiraceae bacterium]